MEADGGRLVLRAREELPLAWLARRKDHAGRPLIDPVDLAAAERLRRDFATMQHTPCVTTRWGPEATIQRDVRAQSPEALTTTQRVIDARRDVEAALKAVGAGLSAILLEVCCMERGLETTERRLGWPPRCGKIVLKLALHRLATHYGLRRPEPDALW